MQWDVFNGDADGICSLIQLRLAEPQPNAMLVTGPKRDIKLLARVAPDGDDRVTVCDISLAKNRDHLLRILEAGNRVEYFDHHDPGEPVEHINLHARIVTKGEMCTACIVDAHLDGAHRAWAVVGAFGDNMNALAARMGEGHDLPMDTLRELGTLINYNGYGASLEDLHFHPDALFKMLVPFATPMAFLDADADIVPTLQEGFASDFAKVKACEVLLDTPTHYAIRLPDDASSRRVSGIHGNRLASDHPDRAHAVLTDRGGVNTISIRAPIATRRGAVDLANQFGGGGRAAAAGIDDLSDADIPRFLDAFQASFADH